MVSKVGLYKDPRKKKPWVVRWYGEYDSATGKQRRYSQAFRLKAEAEDFQAKKKQEIGQGTPRDRAPSVNLGDFCKDWLSARKPEVRPGTYVLYEYAVRRLVDYFGEKKHLHDIQAKDAQVFVSKQASVARGHEGEPLSDWSREQLKRYCKLIFDAAVAWGVQAKNPFNVLRFRKPATRRWHRLTMAEYHELLEAAPTLRWKVFYALAFTSGARVGELFSLTWNDIDFESGRVIISSRDGTATMPPFSVKDHEMRVIPLPRHTVALLAEYQTQAPEGVPYVLMDAERYGRVKAKWGSLRSQKKPWFNRYMVNNTLRDFKGHYRRAGIKPAGKLTIHTLRKCCGQNWADAGLPINVVQKLMGHSKPETTLEFYSQVEEHHVKKAADAIQKMIEGGAKSGKTDARLTPEGVSRRNGGKKQ